jgi:outer membrane murein-binding lipoprotein Lpp
MKLLNIMVLAVLVTGLAVSGCTSPQEEAPGVDTTAPTPSATPAATGDIMDSEISTIESDMAELDALLEDMENVEDMSLTELDGLTV